VKCYNEGLKVGEMVPPKDDNSYASKLI